MQHAARNNNTGRGGFLLAAHFLYILSLIPHNNPVPCGL